MSKNKCPYSLGDKCPLNDSTDKEFTSRVGCAETVGELRELLQAFTSETPLSREDGCEIDVIYRICRGHGDIIIS